MTLRAVLGFALCLGAGEAVAAEQRCGSPHLHIAIQRVRRHVVPKPTCQFFFRQVLGSDLGKLLDDPTLVFVNAGDLRNDMGRPAWAAVNCADPKTVLVSSAAIASNDVRLFEALIVHEIAHLAWCRTAPKTGLFLGMSDDGDQAEGRLAVLACFGTVYRPPVGVWNP